ncbi:MAG: acyl-CoA dehydrogenase family protein [Bacillota bacterium]
MDLTFTPENEKFREQVKAWVKDNLPEEWKTTNNALDQESRDRINQKWDKKLYEGGWAGISWPVEYGGMGATMVENLIFYEEMAKADAPSGLMHGKGLVGPTLFAAGSEEQKKKHLPPILRGDVIWCQGFSEPNAGSDLASLQSKAVIDGDHLILNGQKVWSTWAYLADWIFTMVRTANTTPKHRGITYVLVDLRTPGVTVRPLKQIHKEAEFCEIFYEDVRVPIENVVGEINKGWYVAMHTLNNERSTAYLSTPIRYKRQLDRLADLARQTKRNGRPLSEDSAIRQKLAQAYIEVESFRFIVYRAISTRLQGEGVGPEAAILKYYMSEMEQKMNELAMSIEGPYSQLLWGSARAIEEGYWPHVYLGNRASTIAGGTSEIQRNIIGDRVLGMPR